ncbi:MAG: hypothetical protein JRF64_01475 [Deltaproteobacteria bacterium]|nr:hypothetical protein [Deltaproteobacteria bacterium]
MDECANNQYATARCRPEVLADNRVVAEGEDGYFSGTTGLPVGLHKTHIGKRAMTEYVRHEHGLGRWHSRLEPISKTI